MFRGRELLFAYGTISKMILQPEDDKNTRFISFVVIEWTLLPGLSLFFHPGIPGLYVS